MVICDGVEKKQNTINQILINRAYNMTQFETIKGYKNVILARVELSKRFASAAHAVEKRPASSMDGNRIKRLSDNDRPRSEKN